MSISNLAPTFSGYVATTHDAILLFQAAITGVLPQVPRRPHDRERAELIQSGSVFIFNEHNSGIKRWTDGIAWSPSRILGNFLIYRQLEKPFSPGEKKRTFRQQRNRHKNSDVGHPYSRENLLQHTRGSDSRGDSIIDPTTGLHYQNRLPNSMQNEMDVMGKYHGTSAAKLRSDLDGKTDDRYIVGSLTDTYRFKEDGLVKKTISIQYQGQAYHLVSYYLPDDVRNRSFPMPSNDPRLKDLHISEELLQTRHFRVALDSEEADHTSQLASMGSVGIKGDMSDHLSHHQREPMSTGMSGLGIGNGLTSGSSLYGFSTGNSRNGHDLNHQGRALNMMSRGGMDMSYEMDINNFDHNTYQQTTLQQQPQQHVYYNRGQQVYQLTGLPQHHQQTQHQPSSQVTMESNANSGYSKSGANNYVSGYRPFGVAQLPAPQTSNNGLPPPPLQQTKAQIQVQQTQSQPSRHNPSGRLSTNTMSIPQPDMYQYSSSLQQPGYQYSSVNQSTSSSTTLNPSAGGSTTTPGATSSRRSSIATGANSPSLPPMIQSQSYSYSNYGHDYSGTGSSSASSASDPRRLPGTPSSSRTPIGLADGGDNSSVTRAVATDGNSDTSHINGSGTTPNQQKLYQVPTAAGQTTINVPTTQSSPQQGTNGYSYNYGNFNWKLVNLYP